LSVAETTSLRIRARLLLQELERTKIGDPFDHPDLMREIFGDLIRDDGSLISIYAAEGAKGVLRWLMREGT